jgi:hypothetical protein
MHASGGISVSFFCIPSPPQKRRCGAREKGSHTSLSEKPTKEKISMRESVPKDIGLAEALLLRIHHAQIIFVANGNYVSALERFFFCLYQASFIYHHLLRSGMYIPRILIRTSLVLLRWCFRNIRTIIQKILISFRNYYS